MFTFWRYFALICLFHAMIFASSTSHKGKKGKGQKRIEARDDYHNFGSSWDRSPPGGNEASKGQFPYVVSVQYWGFHYCSGALVSPKWVVSSGQCFSSRRGSVTGLTLVAGMVNVTDPKVEERNLSKIIMHAKYYIDDKCKLLASDIALLQPATEFPLTRAIKLVKLPTPKETFHGKGKLIGWTSHKYGIISLKYVDAVILTPRECRQSQGDWPVNIGYAYHNKSMVCAKPLNSPTALCVGNTGSPLLFDDVLVGLSSTGANPCKANSGKEFIGFYTKISRYVTFIKKYIKGIILDD
ncbi:hypothetical protein ILUMI_08026 [Ignelater luminosus]|uniref:Peptidase S1 domain-containing protein n=1 Tax=Ignelater luminosus TaxID=2038154 RepID=A0A8K0GGB3_IGNLU|nr:hypothetical protein ILUMI_08026 [Ignelater luminosus]